MAGYWTSIIAMQYDKLKDVIRQDHESLLYQDNPDTKLDEVIGGCTWHLSVLLNH